MITVDMELRGPKWKKTKTKCTKLIGVNFNLTIKKKKKNKGECLTWDKIKEENDGRYSLSKYISNTE